MEALIVIRLRAANRVAELREKQEEYRGKDEAPLWGARLAEAMLLVRWLEEEAMLLDAG